jgi:type II secretory pathway pseudopilin PulG
MRISKRNFNTSKGFTLIEMMVFLFIFTISCVSFYRTFTAGTKAMGNIRSRLGATALATEKMEIIRNLSYDNVGTVNGIPSGKLAQDETTLKDGITYYVHTSVVYVDDPFDGTAANATDADPADFKQVKIQVAWQQNNPADTVSLVGTIVPPGLEEAYTGGIISINILDSTGAAIPQAQVTITNNSVNPAVNVTLLTDSFGNIFLPEAPVSSQNYNIQVSKSGYYGVQTYAPYPTSSVSPINVNASVVAAKINQETIVTDKVSTLSMNTVDPLGNAIPSISLGLQGGMLIANTVAPSPNAPQPVWAYNNNSLTTDSSGKLSLSGMSYGQYTLTYNSSGTNNNYVFLHVSQASGSQTAFSVLPGSTTSEDVVLAPKNANSLFLSIIDNDSSAVIPDASVEVKNSDATYDVTLTADQFGQVYFPDASAPMMAGNYTMTITAAGYSTITNQSISVNNLTQQTIKMNAS